MHPLYMSIGSNIREARERAGISQAELGRRLGFKAGTSMWRYEADESAASVDLLQRIAAALGVTANDLLKDVAPGGLVQRLGEDQAAAVGACMDDPELAIPPAHRAQLERLVAGLASSRGLGRLALDLASAYRRWLVQQRGTPQLPPRPPSDDDPNAGAKARGAATGHMQLGKPKKRVR